MRTLYFAYGSNMLTTRLKKRIASARDYATGYLNGWQVICNKRSMDGSGKANLMQREGGVVWGVIYEIDNVDLSRLDRIEGGYARRIVTVSVEHEGSVDALTYVSDRVTRDAIAYDWYRDLIVAGAEEHHLPERYITQLGQMPVREQT